MMAARRGDSGLVLLDAVLVKRLSEESSDLRRLADFDIVAVQHEYRLAVPEERHGGRGGRDGRQFLANPRYCVDIAAGEDRCRQIRTGGMLERHADSRAGFAGRTTAN